MRTIDYINENECEVHATGTEAKRIISLEVVTDGIPLSDLESLCTAYRDNRVVVLPKEKKE